MWVSFEDVWCVWTGFCSFLFYSVVNRCHQFVYSACTNTPITKPIIFIVTFKMVRKPEFRNKREFEIEIKLPEITIRFSFSEINRCSIMKNGRTFVCSNIRENKHSIIHWTEAFQRICIFPWTFCWFSKWIENTLFHWRKCAYKLIFSNRVEWTTRWNFYIRFLRLLSTVNRIVSLND